ncbi:MAG: hypothetical protein KDH96_11895 [Candidatus Riesia sp.]|nr:hypothetical protein [Candidatus Riesia sp.]
MNKWNYIIAHYYKPNENVLVCDVITQAGGNDFIYLNYDKLQFNAMATNEVYQFNSAKELNKFVFTSYLIDFSKIDMAPTFDKILDSLPLINRSGYYAIKQLAEYYSFYHFENEDSYKYALLLLNYYGQEKRV